MGALALAIALAGTSATLAQTAAPQPATAPPAAGAAPVVCPFRVVPEEARVANAQTIAGFTIAFAKAEYSFLQSVALYAGPVAEGAEIAPTTRAARRLDWTIAEAPKDIFVACRYEGGISLSRSVGRAVKTCRADIRPSTGNDARGWGLDSATITCR